MAWERVSNARSTEACGHVPPVGQGTPEQGTSTFDQMLETTSMQSPVAVAALKSLAETDRFRRSEDGQDLLEYGLLAALIAIIAIGAVSAVGNTIQEVFWTTIASSV
jgi:pilus assembly protein Flp/PilA